MTFVELTNNFHDKGTGYFNYFHPINSCNSEKKHVRITDWVHNKINPHPTFIYTTKLDTEKMVTFFNKINCPKIC